VSATIIALPKFFNEQLDKVPTPLCTHTLHFDLPAA